MYGGCLLCPFYPLLLLYMYILGLLMHNNMPGLLPAWIRKDIEQLPQFFFFLQVEMLNLLYILGTLIHNKMPGLLPEWSRKDIEQLPNFFSHGSRCYTCHISWKHSGIILYQAPVGQNMDSTIQRISIGETNCAIWSKVTYPVDSAIRLPTTGARSSTWMNQKELWILLFFGQWPKTWPNKRVKP